MNRHKALRLFSFCVLTFMVIPLMPCFSIPDYNLSYSLETKESKYRLDITVSESLYNAYQGKSHTLRRNNNDYVKFVTPQAFVQVASQIRDLFWDDEDFANAVLMIVHQIPYEVSDIKYPVETIVENLGDCDTFSVLAASLMKAEGLDVILLSYPNHMNLGVHLQHTPFKVRTDYVTYYPYNNKKFYVAETTGSLTIGGIESSWRVGESLDEYVEASIISLENCETSSPGQVTATLKNLESPPPPTPPPLGPPSPAPLIGYEQLLIAFAAVAGAGIFYGFIRLHRRKKTEKDTPHKVLAGAGASVNSQGLEMWKVKQVCPKCGAWISVDDLEYCVCGEKLHPRKSEPAIIFTPPTAYISPTDEKFPEVEKLPEGVWCVCPKCRAYISADIEYCPCGAKLPKKRSKN